MQLYLQFGHGMMAHTRELLADWNEGGAILSPRDLERDQLARVAADVSDAGCEPLLDPQCFARDADHHRLTSHAYWKAISDLSTGAFTGGAGTDRLLEELASLARSMGVRRHILPGCLAPTVNADWLAMQENIIRTAPRHFGSDPLIATVALSEAAMSNEAEIEAVVDRAATWPVSGFYVVAETPTAYLVDSPGWLANLLILASGLKLLKKTVIVGYCSHQMLCLAGANVDAIASGTWRNVRAFPPDKFYAPDEDQQSRRAIWYYCPQALSEYKLPFLDIAQRMGILNDLKPNPALESALASPLFAGPAPSTVAWGEQNAFRHYLTCLRGQVRAARKATFDATVEWHHRSLDLAESLLKKLKRSGVTGQDRDFSDIVDVNRSAVAVFDRARGARLRRTW